VFPLLRPYNSHKFSYRSTPCVYLGQSPMHAAYRCLDATSGRLYLAKHVRFHRKSFPYPKSTVVASAPSPAQPWMTIHWPPDSPDCATPSANTSSTSAPYTSPLPKLIVDLSSYFPTTQPPHHSPPPSQPAPFTASVTRTHHMTLRPSTIHRTQANTATSTLSPILQEPKSFNQANKHSESRTAMQ
jgi:hypothetical protein